MMMLLLLANSSHEEQKLPLHFFRLSKSRIKCFNCSKNVQIFSAFWGLHKKTIRLTIFRSLGIDI